MNGFQAFHTYSKEADRAIQDADFIVTSTGEQNLGDVAQQVKAGMHNKQKKTVFLTAENGINPAKVLRTHLQEAGVEFLGEPQFIEAWGMRCTYFHETRKEIYLN